MVGGDEGIQLKEELVGRIPGITAFGGRDDPGVDFNPWNGAACQRPLARVLCRTAGDVQAVMRLVADTRVPIAVVGGRHDVHARNVRAGRLVVDLGAMSGVRSESPRTITVSGGTTVGPLVRAVAAGRVAVTGLHPSLGVVGCTLGGGYGFLNNRFGMACDTVVAAEVVTADGERVLTDATAEEELFWALRGGGSGFGVVTSMTLATFALRGVLHAVVSVPITSARKALLMVEDALAAQPDRLSVLPIFRLDNGGPSLSMRLFWTGGVEAGEAVVRRFGCLEGARKVTKDWCSYANLFGPDPAWPEGKHWASETRTLVSLGPEAAELLVEAATSMPGPRSVLFLHDVHGAPTRLSPGASAFALREAHYVAAMTGWWEPGDVDGAERQRRWVRRTSSCLAPKAMSGGYVNFLAPEDVGRVSTFYGPANASRLLALKAEMDPGRVFDASTGTFDR